MSRRLSVHSGNILCTEKVCVADHKQFRPVPTLSDLALRTSSVEAESCVDIRQVHNCYLSRNGFLSPWRNCWSGPDSEIALLVLLTL